MAEENINRVLDTIARTMEQMTTMQREQQDQFHAFQKENNEQQKELIQALIQASTPHSRGRKEGAPTSDRGPLGQVDEHGANVDEIGDEATDRRSRIKPESSIHGDFNENRQRWAPGRPKAIRPMMEEGVDDFGWNLFMDKWRRFKHSAGLTETEDTILELRDCCSDQVNRMLFEFIGFEELNRPSLTELELLNHIKTVAVRTVHKEVHRWHFSQIDQSGSEKSYAVRRSTQGTGPPV